ncbi:MAG: 2'-5' RNA ligase family protein [Candidatus Micrarchaeota archaeon]|nr:2'-5' RNA ligase family protein [Candidatus Micrarchaeota archaeon]
MAGYLIEFRIRGYAKRYARSLIYDVAKKFHVRGVTHKSKVVPHITMYGPFRTYKQKDVVNALQNVCSKYNSVPFTFKGFNYFDNAKNKVVYLDIEPSEKLVNLRYELSKALLPITSTISKEDKRGRDDFKFHSTIAFKDIDYKFRNIWNYIKEKERPNIKQRLLRVTLLRNGKILYEYDLLQQRLLNRKEALSRLIFMKTIKMMKDNYEEAEDYQIYKKQEAKAKESILIRIKNLFKV